MNSSHSFRYLLALYFYPNKTRDFTSWNVKRTSSSTFSCCHSRFHVPSKARFEAKQIVSLFLSSFAERSATINSRKRYYLPSQKRKVADSYFPLAFYPFFDPGGKKKEKTKFKFRSYVFLRITRLTIVWSRDSRFFLSVLYRVIKLPRKRGREP